MDTRTSETIEKLCPDDMEDDNGSVDKTILNSSKCLHGFSESKWNNNNDDDEAKDDMPKD